MKRNRLKGENRTLSEIEEHYKIELELSNRLRKSTKFERQSKCLYTSLYDELFLRVPKHPQKIKKNSEQKSKNSLKWQLSLLRQFITENTVFLEIGPGDCSLISKISEIVKKAYCVDVSNVITNGCISQNFKLLISDGSSIMLPDECVDIIYSNQLMEHIHPDDVISLLKEVHRVLKPRGSYLCITPNSVSGPHDISYYFDNVATCFHLKEYTVNELIYLFQSVGFQKFFAILNIKSKFFTFPVIFIEIIEKLLFIFPKDIRIKLGRTRLINMFLGIKIVAEK